MLSVLAPAKVNLVLEVGQRRPDGYHELATIFQSVALYDQMTIMTDTDVDLEVKVTGAQAVRSNLPTDQSNLVWQAANALAEATQRKSAGVRIHLYKHIPIAAGLGGGSSDAAATLRGLARLWGVTDPNLLHRLATKLGSDVAFFLKGGAAYGSGRGEQLRPLQLPPVWLVLANPGIPCNTGDVYATLTTLRTKGIAGSAEPLGERCTAFHNALVQKGPQEAGKLLANDLAMPAKEVTPEIEPLLAALMEAGALGAEVSGSGSTVFALAADAHHAKQLAQQVMSQAAWVWWGSSVCQANLGGGDAHE